MIVSSLSKKKSIYRCDMVLDCIAYVCAKSLQPCPALCDPMDCSPPGSSDNGILQARILEWVAMPFSRGSPLTPAIEPMSLLSPALADRFFTTNITWEVPFSLTYTIKKYLPMNRSTFP